MIAFDGTDLAREPLSASAASEIARRVWETLVDDCLLDVDLGAVDEEIQETISRIQVRQGRPVYRIR